MQLWNFSRRTMFRAHSVIVSPTYGLATLNWPIFFPSPIFFPIKSACVVICRGGHTAFRFWFWMGYRAICFQYWQELHYGTEYYWKGSQTRKKKIGQFSVAKTLSQILIRIASIVLLEDLTDRIWCIQPQVNTDRPLNIFYQCKCSRWVPWWSLRMSQKSPLLWNGLPHEVVPLFHIKFTWSKPKLQFGYFLGK